jgi:hydrogenase maturation protein HypF
MPASLPAFSRALSPSASEIRISGTVQGVGFRPTVWRLAREEGLVGEVLNDGDGVLIRTVGDADAIERLLHRIRTEAPVLSRIESMRTAPLASPPAFADFQIVESVGGENRTRIAADAAICAQCRDEVLDENDRRHGYPFTNCTHCGPRFSIVLSVPYDRPRTTMASLAPSAGRNCGSSRSRASAHNQPRRRTRLRKRPAIFVPAASLRCVG